MKLKLRTIASISLLTLLVGILPAKANPSSPSRRSTQTVNISQNSPINLSLLAEAIKNFWQGDRYLTESVIVVTGKVENIDFQVNSNVKTIAQTGDKFRSEISFDSLDGQGKTEYLVVSNGTKVWVYQPETKQYAVMPYDNFKETFLIGMSSVLFMSFPEDARGAISQDVNAVKAFLQESDILKNAQLQEEISSVDGESFTAYKYKDIANGISMKALIQPGTNLLKQIEFTTDSGGTDILITEKIVQRQINPIINKQTFTFSPPKGAKQVESLSIRPF